MKNDNPIQDCFEDKIIKDAIEKHHIKIELSNSIKELVRYAFLCGYNECVKDKKEEQLEKLH